MLSEHTETVDALDLKVRVDRGDVLTEWKGTTPYLRYQSLLAGSRRGSILERRRDVRVTFG